MKELMTTGELAKKCNVSVRTVQFYDKKGLLHPSSHSDGGRRLFSDEEVVKLKSICLYRSLGFTLEEIKPFIESNSSNIDFFGKVLRQQKEKLNEEIRKLVLSEKKIEVILKELDETRRIEIKSVDEIEELMRKKVRYRKTEVMTYVFLASYVLLLISGFPIAVSLGGFSPWAFMGVAILLLLGLVYYHKETNAYLCSKCHKKFTIGFFTDLFSPNGISKSKYLKCPECGARGWVKDTFSDN